MHTDVKIFSDLKVPAMMVAKDLETGDKVVLKSGNLINALMATISIPGLFATTRIKDRWLVDVGLVDPVPVGVARAIEADIVIAVDLNSGLVSRRNRKKQTIHTEKKRGDHHDYKNELMRKLADYYENAELSFKNKINELLRSESSTPYIMETLTTSIGIM